MTEEERKRMEADAENQMRELEYQAQATAIKQANAKSWQDREDQGWAFKFEQPGTDTRPPYHPIMPPNGAARGVAPVDSGPARTRFDALKHFAEGKLRGVPPAQLLAESMDIISKTPPLVNAVQPRPASEYEGFRMNQSRIDESPEMRQSLMAGIARFNKGETPSAILADYPNLLNSPTWKSYISKEVSAKLRPPSDLQTLFGGGLKPPVPNPTPNAPVVPPTQSTATNAPVAAPVAPPAAAAPDNSALRTEAQAALSKAKKSETAKAIRARFKEMTGEDL